MSQPGSDHGVSEIIGAVLLIGIVVLGLSIAGLVIISTPPPQKTPAISVDVKRMGNTIHLRHEGGDPLQINEMQIIVDGVNMTTNFTKSGSAWSSFVIGDTLQYTDNHLMDNKSLLFVYVRGSAEQTIISMRVPTSTP